MKPFGLSKIPFGLSLSKPSHQRVGEPFDRLRANGGGWVQVAVARAFFLCTASAALVVPVAGSLSAPR
jgi:hypothetical protein